MHPLQLLCSLLPAMTAQIIPQTTPTPSTYSTDIIFLVNSTCDSVAVFERYFSDTVHGPSASILRMYWPALSIPNAFDPLTEPISLTINSTLLP